MMRSAHLAAPGSVHLDRLTRCCPVAAKQSRVLSKSHDLRNLYIGNPVWCWFAIRIRSRKCPCTSVHDHVSVERPVRLNTPVLRRPGRLHTVPRRHNDAQYDANVTLNKASTFGTHAGPSSWTAPASHLRNPSPTIRRPNGDPTAVRKGDPGTSKSNGDTAVRQAEAGSATEGPSHASYLPYYLVAALHILHTSRQS